jgi:hypothetical protein
MSDITPNAVLNQKRLSIELASMRLNNERMELRLMELDDEKAKIKDNMEATAKRITEIQGQLNSGGN